MRLGYSITSAYPPSTDATAAAAAVLERAGVAVEAGFDYVETGDHHVVAPGGYLQSVPTAARLAAVVDHVAPLFILPVYDPVLVAEQVGTIGAFVDRIDVWCTIGAADQVEALGMPSSERVPRFEEAVRLLDRLLTEDGVTFDGEYYAADGISVNPKADPRIVIGGTAEAAVRRAGRLGDVWAANADVDGRALETRIGWIRDEVEAVSLRRDAMVLDDAAAAETAAAGLLEAGYRGWPVDADWPLVGDPESVAADLAAYRDMGVDEVVVRPMDGDHAAETLRGVAAARDRL